MLRGRIAQLNGVDVDKIEVPPKAPGCCAGTRADLFANRAGKRDALGGDGGRRIIRASRSCPSPPRKPARSGSSSADTVTVNVLGRDITARIANLREVQWESLASIS
jgi:putative ABC transport system permease protein